MILSPDDSQIAAAEMRADDAASVAAAVAKELREQGADRILAQVRT
jgi:porphobilinogen deaminase